MADKKPKRGRGRPPEYTMPERIDAESDEIAHLILALRLRVLDAAARAFL